MFKRVTAVLFTIIFVLSCSNTVQAENAANISQYYSVEDKITVYASGISSENPEVRISGVQCEAENLGDVYYKAEKYETVFLIDSSSSMASFDDEIDAFLNECIALKRDNEYYSIGLFASGNNPEYIISSDNNQYNLEKSLDKISYDFQSTYIYDNLLNALDKLYTDSEAIYRRVVLITDGNENSAKGITIDDVLSSIDENNVPIYTVTLQTSTKSNLDALKNVARLARKSNALDIRISANSDAAKYASALFDDVKNIYCISVSVPYNMLDGSKRTMQMSGNDTLVTADVRVSMMDQESITVYDTTVEVETEVSEIESEIIGTESNEIESIDFTKLIPYILIGIAIVIIIVIIIVVVINKAKNKQVTVLSDINLSDNEDTVIIGNDYDGNTELLFDDETGQRQSVILRDVSDSMRIFEVQLSAQGMVIGRSSDLCNIVIDYDKSISRKHCKILLKNGLAYIDDLNSGNKTYVNDMEILSETRLNNADEIKIGRTRFRVTIK